MAFILKSFVWVSYIALLLPQGVSARGADDALVQALRAGQSATVERLLTSRAALNRPLKKQNGFYPLHLALAFGHESLVERLLNLGANPNQPQAGGEKVTPLDLAASIKDHALSLRFGEMLLRHGADLKPKTQGEDNPLLFAVNAGNQEFLDWLINKGLPVDFSAPDDRANTALGLAVARKQIALVRDLLAKGANPTRMFPQGSYLEILARAKSVTSDDVRLAESLLHAGTNLQALDGADNTALHFAVLNHNLALVQWLMAHAAAVTFNNQGQSPLTLAVKDRNYAVVEALVRAGADPSLKVGLAPSAREVEAKNPDVKMHALLNK